MKLGTKVAVCHDGKIGRAVEGMVVATKNGHHVKIKFDNTEFWARRIPTIRYKKTRWCIISRKRYAYFGGWTETDDCNLWCAVHMWDSRVLK